MRSSNSIRKPWSLSEDNNLMELVKTHGTFGWPTVASSMDNRTGKQCRERYMNHLDPEMKKSAWTAEENNLIRDMFSEFGTKWSLYMPFLPGRSDNNIKNRYHTISRNNFSACSDVPIRHLIISNKRAKSGNGFSTEDTDVDSNISGDTSGETKYGRLEKLLAARLVMDMEILLLEKQLSLHEDSSLASSPSVAFQSQRVQGQPEVPVGECFENDFDFVSDWSHDADDAQGEQQTHNVPADAEMEAEMNI